MKYYQIAFPIKIKELFVYKSSIDIDKGLRVIVSLGNTMKTGIVWKEVFQIDSTRKYKNILEIIDKKPIVNFELQNLAEWIGKYYACNVGSALFAMLPSGINIQLQQKVIKKEKGFLADTDGSAERILNNLSFIEEREISGLKKHINISDFYYWLERLEDAGLIEIKRSYDAKIKKKIANYVILNEINEIPKLTPKQKEAYKAIVEIGRDFPLAKIAKSFNYSVVHALQQKGILRIEARKLFPDKMNFRKTDNAKHIILTDEQNESIKHIRHKMQTNSFSAFLLYGITGSGKTEVYINVIRDILKRGKSALMLVPEISLTPQMVGKFFYEFGENIAILHSHLNERERWEQWKKIKSGECRIVIGARSAIFAPLTNIGIIIVDEEHENSYKQENTPRYNARDLAIVRAKMNDAVVILGSATPSLESWENVNKGKYELLKLKSRPLNYKLPFVQIIDMKKEENNKIVLSKLLAENIERRLAKKEQVILFQNRRGHSSFVQCVSCGKLFKCPHCEISLNYHSKTNKLVCHYCGYTIDLPRKCPDCGHYVFNFGAPGTQQVETQLKTVFPEAKILRMDSDTTTGKNSYNEMFERMQSGNVDILLGTQMISKGLDFPNVTLVGVISADVGLNFPDFRAAERTFQLLTQVAGRSGRGEKAGEVIIQTYNPEHYAILTAMKQDFEAFSEIELSFRKNLHYPPYYKIIRMIFGHSDLKTLKEQLDKNNKIFHKLAVLFADEEFSILGPTPAPLTKLNNKYRYHLILKSKKIKVLFQAAKYLEDSLHLLSTVKVTIDVDPLSLM